MYVLVCSSVVARRAPRATKETKKLDLRSCTFYSRVHVSATVLHDGHAWSQIKDLYVAVSSLLKHYEALANSW
jgi:hypothetical protein